MPVGLAGSDSDSFGLFGRDLELPDIDDVFPLGAPVEELEDKTEAPKVRTENDHIRVVVYQKQRKMREWKPIEHLEQIRVTKKVGKRLKMDVLFPIAFSWEDLKLQLFETNVIENVVLEKGFKIDTHTIKVNTDPHEGYVAEIELKIDTVCRRKCSLQFKATLSASFGDQNFTANSVTFSTHDSGKPRKARDPSIDGAANSNNSTCNITTPNNNNNSVSGKDNDNLISDIKQTPIQEPIPVITSIAKIEPKPEKKKENWTI